MIFFYRNSFLFVLCFVLFCFFFLFFPKLMHHFICYLHLRALPFSYKSMMMILASATILFFFAKYKRIVYTLNFCLFYAIFLVDGILSGNNIPNSFFLVILHSTFLVNNHSPYAKNTSQSNIKNVFFFSFIFPFKCCLNVI